MSGGEIMRGVWLRVATAIIDAGLWLALAPIIGGIIAMRALHQAQHEGGK